MNNNISETANIPLPPASAAWLQSALISKRPDSHKQLLRNAVTLAHKHASGINTKYNLSCIEQGLEIAELLLELNIDIEAVAAAIICNSYEYSDLSYDEIEKQLNPSIGLLVEHVSRMKIISALHREDQVHTDRLRKMLLAMAKDIRSVIVKLAERVIVMRYLKLLPEKQQKATAQIAMNVYAPLANRLGIIQFKWELEDLSFRYLQPDIYKELAKALDQKRQQRIQYVDHFIKLITMKLQQENVINFEVKGRAKHIYSIYRKMHRKGVGYEQIYDSNAVRILVDSIDDCYKALSCVHGEWKHIAEEFDDYIAKPKANGYRSLHTAVIGPDNRNIEVQIRTYQMDGDAELGVAAHWAYKEGTETESAQDSKIAWLQQVLAWQEEISNEKAMQENLFADRVYVFTPNNDIVDLPNGATPLDFAYHIHSEVGHRCRGAKVNGKLVQLTHKLQTGEKIEVVTGKQAHPSRDWLNMDLGYLVTHKARNKVAHWFKQEDYDRNLVDGTKMLERELKALHAKLADFEPIAKDLNYKNIDDMLASLGGGDIRLNQILSRHQHQQYMTHKTSDEKQQQQLDTLKEKEYKSSLNVKSTNVQGVSDLVTHTAACCKPVPGDDVIGYVTQGRGISIHRTDCANIEYAKQVYPEKLVTISWAQDTKTAYPVNINVHAYDRKGLARDIINIVTNTKLNILSLNALTEESANECNLFITLEVTDKNLLTNVLGQIQQLPSVINVKRQ